MRSSALRLLPVWVCLLASVPARELTASLCDSSLDRLLNVEDLQNTAHLMDMGQEVVLEGFFSGLYSPKHFVVQNADGSNVVTVFSVSSLPVIPRGGERIQARGTWVNTGTQATLLLPAAEGDQHAVVLCEQDTHGRRLKKNFSDGWSEFSPQQSGDQTECYGHGT